jgi:uncharacterized protein
MGVGPSGVNETCPMEKSFLLVDAHNVIFARPPLSALHARSPEAARGKLLQLLEQHQDASGTRVVAVFDGGSAKKPDTTLSGPAGVQIFYGQSADAVIERLVVKYAAKHRLTVATDDNLIRTAAVAAGASTMGVDELFGDMERAEKELGRTMEKLRRRR